jgi:hypothetical protein
MRGATHLKYRAVGLPSCRLHTTRLASVVASLGSCKQKTIRYYHRARMQKASYCSPICEISCWT